MLSIRRALSFSIASQYTVQIVSLGSIMFLSRLLTPTEIGVFAVASVVLFLAGELRMFGVSQYLIRETELNDTKLRQALGVLIIMSWGLAALVAVGAPYLANFYNEPGLTDILRLVAFTFVLSPFITVPHACLMRNMAFNTILKLNVVRSSTQSVVAVLGAYAGLSYMSMAWALAAGSIVELVLIQFLKPPGIPTIPSFQHLGSVLRFGTFTGMSGLLTKLGEGTPELVLGKLGTMQDVAVFSRGLGLVMIFNRAVTLAVRPVVLPHFSAEYRETGSVSNAYLRAVEMQTGLAWPFFAGFSVAVDPLIRVLYGDQWDASVPISEILVFWGCLFAVYCYYQDALVAVGRVELVLLCEAVSFVLRLGAVITGAQHGPAGVAVAFSIVGFLEFALSSIVLKNGIALQTGHLLTACRRSAGVAVMTFSVCFGAAATISDQISNEFGQLLAFGTLGLVSWILGIRVFKHPLDIEMRRLLSRVTSKV